MQSNDNEVLGDALVCPMHVVGEGTNFAIIRINYLLDQAAFGFQPIESNGRPSPNLGKT